MFARAIEIEFLTSFVIRLSLTIETIISKVLKMQRRLLKTTILSTKPKKKTSYLETLAHIAKSLEDKNCLQHLRLIDSRHNKTRIEQTKDGLL